MLQRFIETGVFLPTLIVALVLSVAIAILSRKQRYNRVIRVWIAACLFLMLYSTVLGRTIKESASIQLIPFWSIGAIQNGLIEVLYEKVYNVLFFVPLGLLLGLIGSSSSSGSNGYKGAIIIGFLTSVGIELLQLITRTGTCETDDVICNTLGCGIGAVMGVGIYRMIRNLRYR